MLGVLCDLYGANAFLGPHCLPLHPLVSLEVQILLHDPQKGRVAQLGEHQAGSLRVEGSIPFPSNSLNTERTNDRGAAAPTP